MDKPSGAKGGAEGTASSDFFTEPEDVYLADKDIMAMQKEIFANNKYEFVETDTRNVLFCGRSRSGKTTAVGVLKNPCYQPEKESIFAGTTDTKFQSFSINNRVDHNVQKFTINVIDTPGLFEITDINSAARTNEAIQKTIAKCIENEITNIHMIVMFATFEAGVNQHDIDAMRIFLSMFGGSGVQIALCITRADNHDQAWRADIISQLQREATISKLIAEENMKIIFMGCVQPKSGRFNDIAALKKAYVSTYKMRENLLQMIFDAAKRVQMSSMNVAKDKIARIKEATQTLIDNYKFFSTVRDFQVGSVQERIILHTETMEFISQNKAYMNITDLLEASGQLQAYITDFKNTCKDPELLRQVVGNF